MDYEVEDTRKKITELNVANKQVSDPRDLSEEDQERFNALIIKSKKYVGEGRIEDALKLNKKALTLCYSEKLAKKVKKMEDYLNDLEDGSDDDTGMTHLGKGFYLYKDLHNKLYVHQQEGVLWFWSLYRQRKGGILGDDMGLGKTIQVIAFLSGMFDMQKISSVLIVLPVAVMVNWENEFKKWAPGLKIVAFHGNSKREKERALARVQRRGGICLTTYGLVVTSWEQLGTQDGREFVWDYMVLDEGHKIKNPTKTSKGVHAIPAKNRIILTGTPVQNNLKELWALFDFVHQGSLLGTQRTFKMEYETPITRAREKDATVNEKKLGMEMAESLKRIISPFFLRRTKAEVKEREKQDSSENKQTGKHAVMPTMTRKNDLIVWTFLGQAQLKIYQDFLHLDAVKELLMTSRSPLVALNVLKKICDHPRLLSTRACSQLGIEGDEGLDDDILETEAGNLSAVTRIQHVADHILINESGKLVFLVKLLDQLKVEGHRCLVFSQSRKMLDIMQKVLTNRGHKIMRLDGTISQVHEREQRIQKFQTDNSYSVFLLTTQVGGVGLTLTAADRVVIYDPSWNPATDAQAVDRVFRIGQNKNVVIYRLITCGTVEEKIYRRQVFKDSITRQTTGNSKNPYRYFSKYELRELFTLDDPMRSTTQQQLEEMHSGQRLTDPSLDEHIAFLYSLEMFGLSDHDLMFSQGHRKTSDDMSDDESAVMNQGQENDYIQHRVQKAQELLQMESQQDIPLEERQGKHQGSQAPGVPRNHMWDFPKPSQVEDNDAKSEDGESTQSSDEDKLNRTDGSDDIPNNDTVNIDLTSPDHKKMPTLSDTIDLTTPVIKQEHLYQNIDRHDEEQRMEIDSTPKKPTIRESLIISPEPSKPLIQTMPVNKGSPMADSTNFSRKLNSTLFGYEESQDVPTGNHDRLIKGEVMVENSPAGHGDDLFGMDKHPIVEDSPNRSGVSEGGRSGGSSTSATGDRNDSVNDTMEESVINDSVISEPDVMEQSHLGDISVHEVKNILERSLVISNGDLDKENDRTDDDEGMLDNSDIAPVRRPVKSRRSISARKPVIESSDEDENEEDDNEEDIDNSDNNEEYATHNEHKDDIEEEMDNTDNNEDSATHNEHEVDDYEDQNKHEDQEDHDSDEEGQNQNDIDVNHGSECDMEESIIADKENTENINTSLKKDTDYTNNVSAGTGVDRHPLMELGNKDGNSNDRVASDKIKQHVNTGLEEGGLGVERSNGQGLEDVDVETEEGIEQGDYSDKSEEEEEEEDYAEDFDDLPEEEQLRYNELVEMGRSLCQQRRYEEGQEQILKALQIFADPELQVTAITVQKKIERRKMREATNGH